ncbi:MAG: hypothetical protein IT440_07995 [Phycisphaeraceae bacterium]|nr:hypothetical protein [Phycisphaeraceae bacterium]
MSTRAIHTRTNAWPAWLAAMAIALTASWCQAAANGEIVVVLSSDASPYRAASDSLTQEFSREHRPSRTLMLDAVRKQGLESSGINSSTACVVAVGTPAAMHLHDNLPADILLTYCMVGNIKEAGLDVGRESFGLTVMVSIRPQIDLMRAAMPNIRKIGVLYRAGDVDDKEVIEDVWKSLPAGLELIAINMNNYASASDAVDDMFSQSPDIVWTFPDAEIYDKAVVRKLLLTSLRQKVPVFGFSQQFVMAGALLGVTVQPQSQGEQAAKLTLGLLGGDPGRLARARKEAMPMLPQYEVVVNLIVAQNLGLRISGEIVQSAATVYRNP